jgi:hypothetical protein
MNSARCHAPHLSERTYARESLDIVGVPSAIQTARIFIRGTLHAWNAPQAVDDALTVGSELVTNAVKICEKTAREAAGRWPQVQPSKLIRLRLLALPTTVAIEVWDRCPSEPQLLPLNLERENGRGLYLVESLSQRWGFYPMRPSGKVVWCQLDVTQQPAVSV